MLSFGMEYERAFSIAFWRARFPPGSPPPSFAATMIARESFEKNLPRFASAAPFLCLIDDHLLCPDKARLLEEELVQPRVAAELGVERGDEEAALAREHGVAVDLRQHLDVRPEVVDPRRADEDRAERPVLELEVGLERRDLPAERVAADGDVDEAEVVAVEDDHSGARPEDRAGERADGVVEAVEAHQARERRRVAAGEIASVEASTLLRLSYPDHV